MTQSSEIEPWEIGSIDGEVVITQGQTELVAAYLTIAADALRLLSHAFGLPFKRHGAETDRDDMDAEEWLGTPDQISRAVKTSNFTAIGWFARDVSKALALLADQLSGNNPRLEWKLRYGRARRGRPTNPDRQNSVRTVQTRLGLQKGRKAKQESAIAELEKTLGRHRSTIFRHKKSGS